MGEQYTHSDAIGLFLTGAVSDGGDQSSPADSLGGFRSSSHVSQLGFSLSNSIPGIIIERVSGANGAGVGSFETIGGNSIRWTAPNGTPGAIIEIANGETKLLESGSEHSKYIIASRNTANALTGITAVFLVPVYNNAIGSSNASDSERQSGIVKLRCIALKATHATQGVKNLSVWMATLATQQVSDDGQLGASGAGTIETSDSFADWPQTGFCRIETSASSLREIVYYSERTDLVLTVPAAGRELLNTTAAAGAADDLLYCVPGLAIANESPVADAFTLLANENDTAAVSGLGWSTAITQAAGLDIGDLAAGEMVGLWLWLVIVAGQTATPQIENLINWESNTQ